MKVMKVIFSDLDLEVRDTPKLRGSVASKFPGFSLLHHHIEKDKFLYQYPRIQYKVINGSAMIIGIEEGIDVLKDIYCDIGDLKIGCPYKTKLQSEINIHVSEQLFGGSNDLVEYCFTTPWMALNQKNYKLFTTGTKENRDKLLNTILIGNILSVSKSLGYQVKSRIHTRLNLMQSKVSFKNNEMIAFRGRFNVNFNIPDHLGIGKSVSRGFGTIKRVES
jgi:hypothetical protein